MEINVRETAAEFVNNYEGIIKPSLEGEFNSAIVALIYTEVTRFQEVIEKRFVPLGNPKAYASYRIAIQYLGGLAEKIREERDISSKDLHELFIPLIDRQVADLDFHLSGFEDYKSFRQTK